MLTADRPALARRAVECFRRQTYAYDRRVLLILDSSDTFYAEEHEGCGVVSVSAQREGFTIGELRNCANGFCTEYEILIHWDDDDYSHPNRIAEQVALLQSSGADCVGYREMLFWDERKYVARVEERPSPHESREGIVNEAWLYSNPDPRYCLGTSLCYWRKTWERKPFAATSQGEDERFTTGLKCVGIKGSGIVADYAFMEDHQPRMIARIHAGNTSNAYQPAKMARAREWRRVPEWDQYVRSVME